MVVILLLVAIILLVLLLIGSLGAVLVSVLQIIEWIAVALLSLALVANLLKIPMRPLNRLRTRYTLKKKIDRRTKLGYDTTQLRRSQSVSRQCPAPYVCADHH